MSRAPGVGQQGLHSMPPSTVAAPAAPSLPSPRPHILAAQRGPELPGPLPPSQTCVVPETPDMAMASAQPMSRVPPTSPGPTPCSPQCSPAMQPLAEGGWGSGQGPAPGAASPIRACPAFEAARPQQQWQEGAVQPEAAKGALQPQAAEVVAGRSDSSDKSSASVRSPPSKSVRRRQAHGSCVPDQQLQSAADGHELAQGAVQHARGMQLQALDVVDVAPHDLERDGSAHHAMQGDGSVQQAACRQGDEPAHAKQMQGDGAAWVGQSAHGGTGSVATSLPGSSSHRNSDSAPRPQPPRDKAGTAVPLHGPMSVPSHAKDTSSSQQPLAVPFLVPVPGSQPTALKEDGMTPAMQIAAPLGKVQVLITLD